jgi:hypothetical protein
MFNSVSWRYIYTEGSSVGRGRGGGLTVCWSKVVEGMTWTRRRSAC